MPQKVEPRLVPLSDAWADVAARLERQCFSDPWTAAAMTADPLRRWTAALSPEDTLIGYLGVTVLFGEAEILRIAVDPAYRRQGVGQALLTSLLADTEIQTVFLEVRASNAAAIALYTRMGFLRDGVRPRYYQNPTEDAMLMSFRRRDSSICSTPKGLQHANSGF